MRAGAKNGRMAVKPAHIVWQAVGELVFYQFDGRLPGVLRLHSSIPVFPALLRRSALIGLDPTESVQRRLRTTVCTAGDKRRKSCTACCFCEQGAVCWGWWATS